MGKFSITYVRKVQTQPYENVTIGLTQEFEDKMSHDDAFKEVRDRVEVWINYELQILGLKVTPPFFKAYLNRGKRARDHNLQGGTNT